jgi:DNA (cytosine-5)-methyltransferase 1
MKDQLTVIDLFCGAGGFSEGFRQAGFKVIWAVDKWKPAVDTHKENHPDTVTICDDVIRLSLLPDIAFHSIIPDSDVIIGSPPCTFFSNSNKSGGGDKSKGKELIKAFLRIIARKKFKKGSKLKYWILENVPKVKKHIKSSYNSKELKFNGNFRLIVKGLYNSEYNAKYYGVPSNRIRYFCGDFPKPEQVIKDDIDLIPLKHILNNLGAPKTKLHSKITDPLYGFELNGEEVTDHHYFQQLSEFEKTKILRLKQDKGYMGKMSVPERPDKPARTIMATMSFTSRECFVLAYDQVNLRAPTIREVASLMSFPIDYRFYGTSLGIKYKLVGNAVPPKMSYAFAKAIQNAEGFSSKSKYKKIDHAHKVKFVNLNLNEIPIKAEKEKKISARFKYHIPYFKFETYRVELTNHHSDFNNRSFKWTPEIHYNQGKDKAKVYTPSLDSFELGESDIQKVNKFLTQTKKKITSHSDFQKIHCMTMDQIKKERLMGPYEFLNEVKAFFDMEFHFRSTEFINMKEAPYQLPRPILTGYYLIYKFTQQMLVQKNRITQGIKSLESVPPTSTSFKKAV